MERSTDEAQQGRSRSWPKTSSTLPSTTSSICRRCTKCSPLGSSSSQQILCYEYGYTSARCYVIKFPDDRPPRTLSEIWSGNCQNPSTWAVLGNQLYSVGGRLGPLRDLWTLDVTRPCEDWKSGPPMLCPRSVCRTAVLDGKLFVFGGCDPSSHWGEFFDPESRSWNALPNPPDPPSLFENNLDDMICVALKDSNRILVSSRDESKDRPKDRYILYTYNVATRGWVTLENKMGDYYGRKAVAVGNSLYWVFNIRGRVSIFAYDLDRDVWLEGPLDRRPWLEGWVNKWGFPMFDELSNEHLVHLEGRRFCILLEYGSCESSVVYRLIIDVRHNFDKEKLRISFVSAQKYKLTNWGSRISIDGCHLLQTQGRAHDRDKEAVSRKRDRGDGMKNRYENLDDHHRKRRKDGEYLRRDHADKQEISHGHRECSNCCKRRKSDDQRRVRDHLDDHRSVRRKDESWFQRERGERQREI